MIVINRESLLHKHGRAYVGIERPKGYRRQWRRKACYRNAALIACRGAATYVQGGIGLGFVVPHAWITLDGKHAIDPTLPDGSRIPYIGIEFSTKLVAWCFLHNDDWPLLSDPEIVSVLKTAADAVAAQAALRNLEMRRLSPKEDHA